MRELELVAAAALLAGCVSKDINSPPTNSTGATNSPPANSPGARGRIGALDNRLLGKQLNEAFAAHGQPVNIQFLPGSRIAWQFDPFGVLSPGPPRPRSSASNDVVTVTKADGPPGLYEGCFITYVTGGDGGGTRPILEVRLPEPSDC